MKTYLISYDLRVPETSEDYTKLIDHIKSYDSWATPLKSVWFVRTSKSVSEVRDDIKTETDANDGLLVIDVTDSHWATKGIKSEASEWMKDYI